MSGKTGRRQELEDAYFMELALKLAEIAVTKGQTPFGGEDPRGYSNLAET